MPQTMSRFYKFDPLFYKMGYEVSFELNDHYYDQYAGRCRVGLLTRACVA